MSVRIIIGDARQKLRELPDESVHCVVTSPPYFGLRDYGVDGQIGLETSPDQFVTAMVEVFRDCRRALRPDGTLWLNLGDSYATDAKGPGGAATSTLTNGLDQFGVSGHIKRDWRSWGGYKRKDLIGIPWMVAFALRADGWWLRQHQPWVKRNPMPESTQDRPTSAVESVFLLAKSESYFYDYEAVKRAMAQSSLAQYETPYTGQSAKDYSAAGVQNASDVKRRMVDKQRGHSRRHAGFNDRWDHMEREEQRASRAFRNTDLFFASLEPPHGAIGNGEEIIALDVATHSFKEAHFATFPPALIEPCIKAGCPEGGTVLDPFGGAGTTGLVADRLGRSAVLIELNPEYAAIAERRIKSESGLFASVKVEKDSLQAAE